MVITEVSGFKSNAKQIMNTLKQNKTKFLIFTIVLLKLNNKEYEKISVFPNMLVWQAYGLF